MRNRSLAIAAVSLGLFALLALVVASGWLLAFDAYAMKMLPGWNNRQLRPIADFFSSFGALKNVVLAAIPLAVWFMVKDPGKARLMLLTSGVFPLSNFLKGLVGRHRPEAELLGFAAPIDNYMSFPSGHTAIAAGFYGFIILLIWRSSQPRLVRLAGAALVGFIILAVGLSRVYLGAHYPTDVIGSLLLGVGWLAAVGWLDAWAARELTSPKP